MLVVTCTLTSRLAQALAVWHLANGSTLELEAGSRTSDQHTYIMTNPDDETAAESMPQGLWFEDFEPGRRIATPGRTVTDGDIATFAGLSGDWNPVHVDDVAARKSTFRGRVAHGMLVQSMATGLAVQTGVFHGTLNALTGMEIRWTTPVRPGDSIRCELLVADRDAEPGPKRGSVMLDVIVRNQDDVVVSESRWTCLVARDRKLR